MLEALKEKWQELRESGGVREWINNNGAAVTVGAVVLLIVSLAIIMQQSSGSSAPTGDGQAWFYDLKTEKYFVADGSKTPPIKNPETGNNAVRAHFFTCGECTEEERFLGYYEKYPPELKKEMEKQENQFEFVEGMVTGQLYCPPDKDPANPDNWIKAYPGGQKLIDDARQRCKDGKFKYCAPGS